MDGVGRFWSQSNEEKMYRKKLEKVPRKKLRRFIGRKTHVSLRIRFQLHRPNFIRIDIQLLKLKVQSPLALCFCACVFCVLYGPCCLK